jgi:hypothetical protein
VLPADHADGVEVCEGEGGTDAVGVAKDVWHVGDGAASPLVEGAEGVAIGWEEW